MTENISFHSNLVRRVHNMALGPTTPSNALVPVFEAIYNGIHALQDRYGEYWATSGSINISLINLNTPNPSIEIRDQGIGLDDRNYNSFRTYDSDHKIKRGGKGLGRLSWLKVFENAKVQSIFQVNDEYFKRSFILQLDNATPLAEYNLCKTDEKSIGTSILLNRMKEQYALHVPSRADTISRKIVAHFLPYFISPTRPKIFIESEEGTFDLSEYVKEKEVSLGRLEIEIDEDTKLILEHNLLEKTLIEGKVAHKIYFAAHDRVVSDFDIGLALGLTTYIDRDGSSYAYAGVISGDLFDAAVNSERTAFDLDSELFDKIKRKVIEAVRGVLSDQIERVIQKQAELTRNVIKKYPRYAYLVQDPRDFVVQKIPRNYRTAEQIYQQLALFDFRDNRDIERKVEMLSKTEPKEDDPIEEGTQALLSRMTAHEFSVLADYTVRRKVVLDLLERRLGYLPNGQMKHHSEEALHSFIVPMRVENGDVHVDRHNLWIIDDKLSYYEYWASDKQLKKVLSNSASTDRPDVLFFAGRSAYHRPGTDQPVVIVEFKRPARNEYDEEQNPFTQIYGYIEDIREGKVLDKGGGVIQEVTENTPFFCYIVADFTPNMRKWLRIAQINVPLPGGGGYYGYNPDYKAFVQAISYKYMLKDARLRNEGFFKQLKI